MRSCGILLPISSLPGSGPIGTMGEQARRFVQFLQAAGHTIWQVLPITAPARGNSPYSSYSVFAGNPYLIDLPTLQALGLLPAGTLGSLPGSAGKVDYKACKELYPRLLRQSFEWSRERERQGVEAFCAENAYWIDDYALFMALLEEQGGGSFLKWEKPLLLREEKAIRAAKERLRQEICYWQYVQYLFYTQWRYLKRYANERGIRIMGDMPIYADVDSVEIWAHPEYFQLDEARRPLRVAGVPPDSFAPDGQLWGNPLYNWDALRERRYAWWIKRLQSMCALHDMVRIDHFRGLDEYYSIPADAVTARSGRWERGPGMDFVDAMRAALPFGGELVAEDLGYPTGSLTRLLQNSGLPGMKVLQFAFEPGRDSGHLPHHFPRNCVAYIGTHDNDTIHGWLQSAPRGQVDFALRYVNAAHGGDIHWSFIRALYASVADKAIVQMQDVLGLDGSARMNVPSVPGGNWLWRMEEGAATPETIQKLAGLAALYGRTADGKNKGEAPDSAENYLF